jgi:long-subunit fatty acid transport protein
VNLPDTDHFLLALGSSWQINEALIVDGAYEHSIAFARPNMNVSTNNTDPITHVVALNGQYDVNVDVVSLSVRYRF